MSYNWRQAHLDIFSRLKRGMFADAEVTEHQNQTRIRRFSRQAKKGLNHPALNLTSPSSVLHYWMTSLAMCAQIGKAPCPLQEHSLPKQMPRSQLKTSGANSVICNATIAVNCALGLPRRSPAGSAMGMIRPAAQARCQRNTWSRSAACGSDGVSGHFWEELICVPKFARARWRQPVMVY